MANRCQRYIPWIDLKCKLGEGPWYNEKRNEVRFLDIMSEKLYTADLNEGQSSLREYDTGSSIGVTADIEGSDAEIVAGSKEGFAKFNLATGKKEILAKFWPEGETEQFHKFRSNDGACDSRGRFWVGAFNDPKYIEPQEGAAVMFRFDPDGSIHRMWDNLSIPNGFQWSADDKTMYMTDGPAKCIWQWDFEIETGKISNQRPFFKREEGPGDMDGSAMDEEGCIWNAVFGGGRVLRIAKDGSKVIGEVKLPTKNITCPFFAGTELIITSAVDDSKDDPISDRYGGSVFRIDVGVKGRPRNTYKDMTR
ncbi:putative calcium homeostasis protein [Phaeomoniella chlamydospora]|uniref:Putative calcium homeostasis protein n=1 Tax=Phaeomoniella chlamydospora TaxID=158046 RepID=A0A0G2EN98_PHACM|nr:putative calcium homeostasis protein [Phaeomoniella chlamydospora]